MPAAATTRSWKARSAVVKSRNASACRARRISSSSSSSSGAISARRGHGPVGRPLLDQRARLDDVVRLLRRDGHDQRALLGVEPDQPLGLQPQQRLAHGRAGDAEPLGDVALGQQGAAGVGALEDGALEVVVGPRGRGGVGGRGVHVASILDATSDPARPSRTGIRTAPGPPAAEGRAPVERDTSSSGRAISAAMAAAKASMSCSVVSKEAHPAHLAGLLVPEVEAVLLLQPLGDLVREDAKTALACTGAAGSRRRGRPGPRLARRRAIALAWPALRSHRSPASSASNCTETKRILEASCIDNLRR